MHILIRTPFFPSLGGLEAVMRMLAEAFSQAGHEVTVVTPSPNKAADEFPFRVLRNTSFASLWQAHSEADMVILGNISLWWWLMLCVCPRPWVATHHGWYRDTGKPPGLMNRIKVRLVALADANVSVSGAVNRFLGCPGVVIPNPYDARTFRVMPEVPRDRDLVFLGRLVSDKGADVLVEALALLKARGLRPGLTIIGCGPELEPLQKQALKLGVSDLIDFAGQRHGAELAQLLNAHRLMVIPSLWDEPFGVVALEGIACGCVIVGSSGGGLPEAIGPCGVTFPNGDAAALADALEPMLRDGSRLANYREAAAAHLAAHDLSKVVESYLQVCRAVLP